MYYEINVSKHGVHFFATAERSIDNEHKLKEVYQELSKFFKPEHGYKLTITRYDKIGRWLEIKDGEVHEI